MISVWTDEFGTHRAKVIEFNGELGMEVRWTATCTGCSCDVMTYDPHAQCDLGMGCHECGYHGKVRRREWVPLPQEAIKSLERRKR